MSKRWLLSLSLVVFAGGSTEAAPRRPVVEYSGKRVVARPADTHRPMAQAIYVADTEECSARAVSNTMVEVPERCKYLRGLYRYIFQPEGEVPKRQMLVGFALTRTSATSYAFLADEAVEIEETALTP